ncbi:uncharacterized protein LOC142336928 [Convolutriloba macropyga]|uniref:uncharacterized protein LOC142336928 n=1 Tax=Convolutriloba macropyga TaxID=536237 RepID=UPI003F522116
MSKSCSPVESLSDDDLHDCRTWQGYEDESLLQLIQHSNSHELHNDLPDMIPKEFREHWNSDFMDPKSVSSSNANCSSSRPNSNNIRPVILSARVRDRGLAGGVNNKGGQEEFEDTWLGLHRYKQQKCLVMYPKSVEREVFIMKEVYRRLLLQKLQLTMSELEDFRKFKGLQHAKQTNAVPTDHGMINPAKLHQRIPKQTNTISYQQVKFTTPELWKKPRPNSANNFPTIPGKSYANNDNTPKKSSQTIEALDIDAQKKQSQCEDIFSFLTKTEDNETFVKVPKSFTLTLLKSMSNKSDQKFGPYKASLKNGSKQLKHQKSLPNNYNKKLSIQSESLNRVTEIKPPDGKSIHVEHNSDDLISRSKTSNQERQLVQRYSHASLLRAGSASELKNKLMKTAEVTDFKDFREFVEMTQLHFE